MKLPNDLIKATDYSKAKNRERHEFEYRNEKYIHKYVLGGEHELTPQEIIDCLNAISTIDCDLQTAYAYIKGQNEKITDLEAKLAEKEHTITTLIEDHKASQEWYKKQLAEKEKEIELMAKTLKLTKFIEKEVNQDKISFTVEKLEEARKFAEDMWGIYKAEEEIEEFIKNQINVLRNNKDGIY